MSEQALIDFVRDQRWFGAKSRIVGHAAIIDRATLRDSDPTLELQIVEMRFDTGTHETYQLLTNEELDALADPQTARELVRMIRASAKLPADEGIVEFGAVDAFAGEGHELREARAVGTEQTNTSIVFDDELILKVFRRLEAGINPELELLRFLTLHEFANIPALGGWYAYTGRPMDTTLGILQRYVANGIDGWDLALGTMAEGSEEFLQRLHRLGMVTGQMHTLLGSDTSDPTFAPEEPSAESIGLLTASIDDEIESIFVSLPEDNETLAPIYGRGEEVRERLRLLTQLGGTGRVIRHHGDFHLGQTLWSDDDWVLIDFEGEPARSLTERRRKRSPLRDVAGILRSFAYAATATQLLRGVDPPPGWEARAREEFLRGYRSTIEPSLIPSGSAMDKLLAVFELEKAVYELRYEMNHRPDWLQIPVAGIVRMLDEELPT